MSILVIKKEYKGMEALASSIMIFDKNNNIRQI